MTDLFPYQVEGALWLSTKPHALLADEMGLGKSAQAIAACDHINATNILVVCPASVRVNWTREFDRFSTQKRPITLIETGKVAPQPGINVVSYDLIAGNEKLRKQLKERQWCALILDEVHYLKERTAKRTKAIYGHNKHPGIAHSARHVWRLSGTPMPNNPSELYTHLKSAGVETRSYYDFVFQYCDGFEGNWGYQITGTKQEAIPALRQQLSTIMLRRKKEDVAVQLPPIVFHEITVPKNDVEVDPWFYENWAQLDRNPGKAVAMFLDQLNEQNQTLAKSLNAIQQSSHYNSLDALRLIESYAKSTSTLRRYIGLAKLNACLDIIEEELKTNQYAKIVLFAVHAQVIEQTRQRFRKFGAVTLFGGTPPEKRQRHIDMFQKDKHCRVFVGQVVAAGTGITLTAASEVAFLEASWVPADNAQAAMRVHRIGQTEKVRCRFFVCADTVDEQVMRVVAKKSRDIAKVLD